MPLPRRPILDSSLALLGEGYGFLPNRWRRSAGGVLRLRLMGQHAVALRGPAAVRFFYDQSQVSRRTAVPEPVQGTLFGRGAVHTLDGEAHRVRKAMFLALLTEQRGVDALVDHTVAAWDDAVTAAAGQRDIVLFDEASRVLTRAVCRWAGVPLDDTEAEAVAADLVAMVDGFATPGPRHWRARRARGRREDWARRLVEDARTGRVFVAAGSAVDVVARHRGLDGAPLDAQVAAVELLNVLRPTVAVSWFVAFAAHALHRWPEQRARLRKDDPAYAEAFVHEVRRFYPFAPFLGGKAVKDLSWRGEPIPAGALVLLDVYGQNHDPDLWERPYDFDPQRFLDRPAGRDELIPQGGADPATGHRCPGEPVTVALLQALSTRLAGLDYDIPAQDLTIPLGRIPTRPRSGMILRGIRSSTG